MTTDDTVNRDELRRQIKLEDAIAQLRGLGVDESAITALEAELHTTAPTLHDYLGEIRGALKAGQRKTYGTYVDLLDRGAPTMCACTCEACLPTDASTHDAKGCPCTNGGCGCPVEGMLEGRASCDERFEGLGDRPMCTITSDELEKVLRWVRVRGKRRQLHRNRRRAQRGRTERAAHGALAEEHMALLIRYVWKRAAKNPATRVRHDMDDDIKVPKRPASRARHVDPAQLEQVWDVVWSGGNDPELDMLIVWIHLEGGLRRSGAVGLTCSRLDVARQGVRPLEKNDVDLPQPISYRLLRALIGHALERGDVVNSAPAGVTAEEVTVDMVINGEATLRPDAPVLYYRRPRPVTSRRRALDEHGQPLTDAAGRPKVIKEPVLDEDGEPVYEPHPLTRRRYNTLFDRLQKALPWADQDGLRAHDLRHTGSVFVERATSYAVAKAWLRHADNSPTDTYVKATFKEVATALSLLTGEDHPCAQ